MGFRRLLSLALAAFACAGTEDRNEGGANTLGDGDSGSGTTTSVGSEADATSSGTPATSDSSGTSSTSGTSGGSANATPAALRVDVANNGVLEPGEQVVVEPAWEAESAATVAGMLVALSGTEIATYEVVDGEASYGLGAGPVYCSDGTRDCYSIRIEAQPRPAMHWDATADEALDGGAEHQWVLHLGGSFTDVDVDHPQYAAIESLLHYGITAGCGESIFCPSDTLTREAAALLIARAMLDGEAAPSTGDVPGLGAYDCDDGPSLFSDVPVDDPSCGAIHYLAANEVTAGCGVSPPSFCPDDPALRSQLAAFVAAAIAGGSSAVPDAYDDAETGDGYDCGEATPNIHFVDVPAGSPLCPAIHYLWARGFIDGCGADTFCPTDETTRAVASDFITRGFELALYGV